MNYEPVVIGNQPNHNAAIKENLDAGKVRKETVSAQQYVLLPLWSTGSQDPQNTDDNAAFDVKENENEAYVSPINNTNIVNASSAPVNVVGPNPTNITNSFNVASPSDIAVSLNFEIGRKSSFVDPSSYPDDPDMPALEDIVYSDGEEDVGVEADFSNLETNISVSPIPTTRVHKDHIVTQIIGELTSAPQTKSMARMFKMKKVWVLVYLPKGKRAIGSKWVFKNKKDKRGIVIRNKARLVAQGHTLEEGIDYEEVFAPVARIEAIWLFLAYASFMGFMDLKTLIILIRFKRWSKHSMGCIKLLELDITYFDDEEDIGAEADFTNLETTITVSPIPTTRVHKDHHVTQIIGDLSSATQTRIMTRMVKDQGGLTQITNEDFHTCMFACFLSQEEPKRIHQALKDPSWIEAMQEELLKFKMQKVWVLVDLPKGKKAIGSKWVFRNKKDERGIVIRNKARLVAQRHTQEDGIDYEEVFAPVTRIEAIRLFLAYASFMGFMVYQMDVKSAFLYGTIEKEVYVCQPPRFKDPDYPDKLYKMVKALYGLHQAPRAWYETLANYLLENGFQRGKIDQTLFIKKQKGDILLVQVYVDDIIFCFTYKDLCKAFEKLMKDKFQMSLISELTFFLGLQVKQKQDGIFISQDKYVGEILRKFGLTDGKLASTPIDNEKPLLKDPDGDDVDVHTYRSMIGSLMYLTSSRPDIMFAVCTCARFQVTGASLDRKSTTGGCQFLGCRLISWQCKKQIVVATSSTEADDYAGASLDRKSITGGFQFLRYRLISWQCKKQAVVAASSIEAEYVAAATHHVAKELASPKANGSWPKLVLLVLIEAQQHISNESPLLGVNTPRCDEDSIELMKLMVFLLWAMTSIKKVNDVVRLQALIDRKKAASTTEEIFTEFARMGYEKPPPKLTFYNAFFSAQWKFLIHTLVQCVSVKMTVWNEFSCSMASAVICLANAQPAPPSSPPQEQPTTTSASDMTILDTLMETCTTLSHKVAALKQDKVAQALEIFKLKRWVKRKKVVVTEDGIRHDLRLDDADGVECLPNEEIFTELACISAKRTTWNEFSCSIASAVICLATVIINAQVDDLSSHTNQYTSLALTQKVFANMRRVEKEEEVEVPAAPTLPSPSNEPSPPPQEPITTPPQFQPAPLSSPPQEQQTNTSESSINLLNTLMETSKEKSQEVREEKEIKVFWFKEIEKDAKTQVDLGAELQWRKDDDNVVIKDASATEPTMLQPGKSKKKQEKDDMEKDKVRQQQYVDKQENIDWNVVVEQMQKKHLDNIIGMTYDKVRPVFKREYNKLQTLFKPDKDVEEPHKKIVAKETLLQESFKKLKADEVSDMLKDFDREDMDALWRLVKEKFSSAVPTVDKEKALWVELKRLFEPDTYDVLWKLQIYMHYPIMWKLISNCGAHQGRINEEDLFGVHDLSGDEVFVDVTAVTAAEKEFSIADPVTTPSEVFTGAEDVKVAIAATITQISKDELTLAQILMEIKAAKPKAKGAKDKGKGIMVEPEKPLKMKDQIALDEEVARKLEAKMKAKMEEE
nr:putative ribonuclease H-like domain-containing protein [Tanacetum cinerariifolium]